MIFSPLYTFQCGTQVPHEGCILSGKGQRRCPHHPIYRCRLVKVTLKCRSCPSIFNKDPRSKQVDCLDCQDRVRLEKRRARDLRRRQRALAKPGFCTFPGCSTRLSIYNRHDRCFLHQAAELDEEFADIGIEESEEV